MFTQLPLMLICYIGKAHLANYKSNISTLLLTPFFVFCFFFTNVLFLFQDATQHVPLHLVQLF